MRKLRSVLICLLSALFLFVFSPVKALAYTADTSMTGYPYIVDNFRLRIHKGGTNYVEKYISPVEQNSYTASLDAIDVLNWIELGNYGSSFIFPYDPDLYDYYLVGTMGFTGLASSMNLDFYGLYAYSMIDGVITSQHLSCDIYDFNSNKLTGFSFSADLSDLANSNLNVLNFDFNDGSYIPACDFWFSASVVPVAKGSEAEEMNQSILNELIKINQNLVTSNSLQQSTIDSINTHDTNVGNWFTELMNRMGAGFTALYSQMTKEQDEQLNGYTGTSTSSANTAFSAGAGELTNIEGQLSSTSTTYVNDFTTTGFDASLLTTIASSITFVVTWFTNFWNMGGILTAGLGVCFAIGIAFYILRIKR